MLSISNAIDLKSTLSCNIYIAHTTIVDINQLRPQYKGADLQISSSYSWVHSSTFIVSVPKLSSIGNLSFQIVLKYIDSFSFTLPPKNQPSLGAKRFLPHRLSHLSLSPKSLSATLRRNKSLAPYILTSSNSITSGTLPSVPACYGRPQICPQWSLLSLWASK